MELYKFEYKCICFVCLHTYIHTVCSAKNHNMTLKLTATRTSWKSKKFFFELKKNTEMCSILFHFHLNVVFNIFSEDVFNC